MTLCGHGYGLPALVPEWYKCLFGLPQQSVPLTGGLLRADEPHHHRAIGITSSELMTNRVAAMRYARALLEISEKDADPERVEREVASFVDLMDAHPALGSCLVNPSVAPAQKTALMSELLPRLGGVSDITQRLLTMLADRDRLVILKEILEVYRERLMERRGVVRAIVTTASTLSPERVRGIARSLESATGKEVEIETGVDAALVGGMVTQIGSIVYDGSISQHLARLRRRFLGDA